MKENKLTIFVQKPVTEVFEFSTNPRNTPLWLTHLAVEETNEWPIKLGTIYRNKTPESAWDVYQVSELRPNELFQLTSADGNYHVRYTYKAQGNGTVMEYYEWVNDGVLSAPFKQAQVDALKTYIEKL